MDEVRYSDRNNIFELVDDNILIDIGKNICVKIDDWEDMDISNVEIAKEINKLTTGSSFEVVKSNNNLITFIRYQSIAELCPNKMDKLSKLIEKVSKITKLPIIASGGAGNFKHILDLFLKTNASGAACGSIFHFADNNPIRVATYLAQKGIEQKKIKY